MNQNNIDFSDYRSQQGQDHASVMPPDLGLREKKIKIQLTVIIACSVLAIGFWGYYFYQQDAKNRAAENDIIPAEMIPN